MSKKLLIRYRSGGQRILSNCIEAILILINFAHTLYVQIRASVEEKEGRKFDEFTAVKYCTQVVAGINYFIKVPLLKFRKCCVIVQCFHCDIIGESWWR